MSAVERQKTRPAILLRERKCLDLNTRILYYLGLWPVDDEPPSLQCRWRKLFPRLQLARCCYTIVIHLLNVYLVWGNLSRTSEFVATLVMTSASITHGVSLYLYRHSIRDMFATFEHLHEPGIAHDQHLRLTLRATERFAHNFTRNMMVAAVTIFFSNGISLVSEGLATRTIPLRLWFPYDAHSTPMFELTLIVTNLLAVVDGCICLYPHVLFIALLIHLIGQYKLLSYKVENIRSHVEAKINRVRTGEVGERPSSVEYTIIPLRDVEDVESPTIRARTRADVEDGRRETRGLENDLPDGKSSELRSGKARVNDGGSEGVYTIECQREGQQELTEVVQDGRGGGRQEVRKELNINEIENGVEVEGERVAVDTRGRGRERWDKVRKYLDHLSRVKTPISELDFEMERYLRHSVKHHQTVLRLTQDLEHIFNAILRFQIFGNALTGFGALYVTTLAPHTDSKVVTLLMVVLGIYTEFFYFCWFGNQLTVESEKLREAVYGCDWFTATEGFKRSIRIMISRTNQPVVVRGGGLPLSMKSFRFIVRTAYYLHNVLAKIFHGIKINDKTRIH